MIRARKAPCKDCPFRVDCNKGWLGEARIKDIVQTTVFGDLPFLCHKTSDLSESRQRFCAGKLILESRVNPLGNLHTRLGMGLKLIPAYNELKNQGAIFKKAEDAIMHHSLTE